MLFVWLGLRPVLVDVGVGLPWGPFALVLLCFVSLLGFASSHPACSRSRVCVCVARLKRRKTSKAE